MPARDARLLRWQIGLLLPFPPLSLLYLLAVRAERIRPSFPPLLGLALLPLAATVLALLGLRRRAKPAQGLVGLLVLGVVEVLWAILALAMVGFAIAWRSG